MIPDSPVDSEADFAQMMSGIRGSIETALDTVMACSPTTVILARSAEHRLGMGHWIQAHCRQYLAESRANARVILGGQACRLAM